MLTTPAASLTGFRNGIREYGPDNETAIIWEERMDSKVQLLTPNTTVIYVFLWLDLKNGPMVMEAPPKVLGLIDDFWFRYVTDFGMAGPDKGKGGKYLILPPGYEGDVPDGLPRRAVGDLRQLAAHPRLPGGRRPEAGREEHQGQLQALSPGQDGQRLQGQVPRHLHEVPQHHSRLGRNLLRGDQQGRPGRALRVAEPRDPRPAGLYRHREGQALRAGRAHAEDPEGGGGCRLGSGACGALSQPRRGGAGLPGQRLGAPLDRGSSTPSRATALA